MINLPNKPVKDFQKVSNTLLKEVKSNPKDLIQIEIGDSKQPDFKPQYKISRWDNEVNFSIRAKEDLNATVEIDKDVIKYKTPDYEVHLYEKPEVSEDGGFEFEWVLPAKPASNVLEATIQTKGLNFFYQPALTQEEIDEGVSRPKNVEGSYAVYHKTKGGMNRSDGMEYKVGKAFHIYRPKAIDANGVETWAELNINEQTGVLSVTIPQSFLDNAVYPVIVDPTFGNTSIGGTSQNQSIDRIEGTHSKTPGESGTLDSISYYGNQDLGTARATKGVLYLVSDVSNVAVGAEVSINNGTPQWWVSTASSESLSNTNYYVGFFTDGNLSNNWTSFYDTIASATRLFHTSLTYPTVPDPSSTLASTRAYSIYATYTASGGGVEPTKNPTLLMMGAG